MNRNFDKNKRFDKDFKNKWSQFCWSVGNKMMNIYFNKDIDSQSYHQKHSGNSHQSRKNSYFKDSYKEKTFDKWKCFLLLKNR